jgi:hypothetical protein
MNAREPQVSRTLWVLEDAPPATRPRWFCHLDGEPAPGFETPEEAIAWGRSRAETFVVRPLDGPAYWAGAPPKPSDSTDTDLRPWPPTQSERQRIELTYASALEREKAIEETVRAAAALGLRPGPALALALARRLDAATPDDVRVLSWPAANAIAIGDADSATLVDYRNFGNWAASFAESALAETQEYMIEFVAKGGWPPADPASPEERQSAAELPAAGAEIDGEVLRIWYGTRDSPSLALAPITAQEIKASRAEAEDGDNELAGKLWGRALSHFVSR